jgi:hypothetical protein
MSLPRTTRLPSDRAPDRKRTPHTSPALSRVEQELARPRHRTAAQDEEKAADDSLNRKRLARLAYRAHGGDPDTLKRERVEQVGPIPAKHFEIEAQAEFQQFAAMLGLTGGTP